MNINIHIDTFLRRTARKVTAFALATVAVLGLAAPTASAISLNVASGPNLTATGASMLDHIPDGDYLFDMGNGMGMNSQFASTTPIKARLVIDPLGDQQPHEIWRITNRSSLEYPNAVSIHPAHAPWLSVNNYLAQKTPGQPLTLHNHDWSKGLDFASLWIPHRNSDGSYTFTSAAAPNLAIDCQNNARSTVGNPFILYTVNHTQAQNIFLKRVGGDLTSYVQNGNFVLTPGCAPNSAIEVRDSSRSNGAAISIWTKAFQSDGKIIPTMTWRVEVVGKNRIILWNGNSGKAWDIYNGSKSNDAACHQWDLPQSEKTTRKSTMFDLIPAPGGGFYLKNVNSGLYLDVQFASSANGSRLMQHSYHGGSNQIFHFTPADQVKNNTKLSTALYHSEYAALTCGFDGYSSTGTQGSKGYRHEGIDFQINRKKVTSYSLYALNGGEITYINRGSSGLSTLAVYDASRGITVIYLHLNIDSNLSAGQNISKGQYIGTEGDRGSAGVLHTHVEIRPGRQTRASVSSDKTLVNPNPTPYWNQMGYTVG